MNNQLHSSPPSPPSTSPSTTSPTSPDLEQHPHQLAVLPPAAKDAAGSLAPVASVANAVRMMNDLTDTPPYSRSVTSTAPSSPRM
jgi:6-phosphofructo-2-kinase